MPFALPMGRVCVIWREKMPILTSRSPQPMLRIRRKFCVQFQRSYTCVQSSSILHGGYRPERLFLQPVLQARVPIVRIYATTVQVDLSVENNLPVFKSKLLLEYTKFDRRYSSLVRIVKAWAKSRDINSAQHGTFNSFGLSLLVLHYLQNLEVPILPRLNLRVEEWVAWDQDWVYAPPSLPPGILVECDGIEIRHYTWEELKGWVSQNTSGLSMLTHGFFKYFAREFPWETHVVSVTSPGLVLKSNTKLKSGQSSNIFIQDPIELDDNCARSIRSDTKKMVIKEFERAYCLDFCEFLCSFSSLTKIQAQLKTRTQPQTQPQTQTQTQPQTLTQTHIHMQTLQAQTQTQT
mmetsp:Transcript_28537/g.45830  ORF Transcript_28537/g.45830 Transcript_28537/m.45830 type:complete len:349 (-) Transcript_28537:34-1080(-)